MEELLKVLAPIALSWAMNRGPGQAQDAATNEQMDIARRQTALQEQLAALDLPFRKNLLAALQGRQQSKRPRMMMPGFQQFNPYGNVNRVQPTQNATDNPKLFNMLKAIKGPSSTTMNLPAAMRPPAPIPLPAS